MIFTYGKILKQNQFKDPRALAEGEVSRMYDMVTDKTIFKPVIRGGITQIGTLPSVPKSIHQLGDGVIVGKFVDGSLQKTADGVSWSVLESGLSNDEYSGVPIHDKLYLFGMSDEPKVTDGVDLFDYNLPYPDATKIKSSHKFDSTSQIPQNAYIRYAIVFFTEKGQFSRPSQPFTHFASATAPHLAVTTSEIRFDLDAMPIPSDVDTIYIFRTLANKGVFYFLKSIPAESEYFTDTAPNEDLDLSWNITYQWHIHNAQTAIQQRERLFVGNVRIEPIIKEQIPLAVINTSPPSGYTAGYKTDGVQYSTSGNLVTESSYEYKLIFKTGERYSVANSTFTVTLDTTHKSIQLQALPKCYNEETMLIIQRREKPKAGMWGSWHQKMIKPNVDNWIDAEESHGWSLSIDDGINNAIEYPSMMLFSEIGAPQQLNAENYNQINPEDGDEIVSLVPYGEDVLILKRNSIYAHSTYGTPKNWQLKKITANIGCDNHRSVQFLGRNVYFAKNNEIYRFPDRLESPLSLEIKDTISDMGTIYASAVSPKYNWYIALADGAKFNYAIVYDEDIQGWYVFRFSGLIMQIMSVVGGSLDGELIMLSSSKFGKYDESTGQDFGSDITAEIDFGVEQAPPDRQIRVWEVGVNASAGSQVKINGKGTVMSKDNERLSVSKFAGISHEDSIQLKITNLKQFVLATIKANTPKRGR